MVINQEIRLPSNLTYVRSNQNLIVLNKNTLSLLLNKRRNNQMLTTNMCVAFYIVTTVAVKSSVIWDVTPCSLVEVPSLLHA
jgi:hypothetical protein